MSPEGHPRSGDSLPNTLESPQDAGRADASGDSAKSAVITFELRAAESTNANLT